jgi:hypothetical protein
MSTSWNLHWARQCSNVNHLCKCGSNVVSVTYLWFRRKLNNLSKVKASNNLRGMLWTSDSNKLQHYFWVNLKVTKSQLFANFLEREAWSRIFNWAKREGENKIMSTDSQNCMGGRWMQGWMTTRNRSIHLLLPLSECSNMWFSGLNELECTIGHHE